MAKHQLISLSGTNFWDVYNPNANNGSENIPEKYSNSIYHFIIVLGKVLLGTEYTYTISFIHIV